MTVEVRLTPEQEAILTADAARRAKSVADVLLDRAFPSEQPEPDPSEIERRLATWRSFDRAREERVTPAALYDAKMDAEFFYAE